MNRPDPLAPQVPSLLVGEGPPQIVFVGEAPGRNEEIYMEPFAGYAGDMLRKLLREAFFPRPLPTYLLTNVFPIRPERNDINLFFGTRQEGTPGLPPMGGKYLLPPYAHFLDHLRSLLARTGPKLVIALGNTALWALTGRSGITKLRGIILESPLGLPILPSFHPAYVAREEALRPILVADLSKAADHVTGVLDPERGKFSLTLNPALEDLPELERELREPPTISVDVETSHRQITILAFGLSRRRAICIPFWDPRTFRNYWPTVAAEAQARRFVQRVLANERQTKLYHNGVYDLSYLLAEGYRPRGPFEDTMLLHHALQPEMEKSLGFLGATYTDEPEWKSLNPRRKKDLAKEGE